MAALNIYREHTKILSQQSTALDHIVSGYKVSSAKDSPTKISQSEKMRMQIRGLQMAARNAQDGISLLQTADGGMEQLTSMLQRIKELSLQAATSTTTSEDKEILQNEIEQLINGYDDIANNTQFNGVKILAVSDPTKAKISMMVSANKGEEIVIELKDLTSSSLMDGSGKRLKDINVTSWPSDDVISVIDASLDSLISQRGKLGALSNRFDTTLENVNEIGDRIQGAESAIRDSDVAEEMMEYSRCSVLVESGHAMMVQANRLPQDILRVLERK